MNGVLDWIETDPYALVYIAVAAVLFLVFLLVWEFRWSKDAKEKRAFKKRRSEVGFKHYEEPYQPTPGALVPRLDQEPVVTVLDLEIPNLEDDDPSLLYDSDWAEHADALKRAIEIAKQPHELKVQKTKYGWTVYIRQPELQN